MKSMNKRFYNTHTAIFMKSDFVQITYKVNIKAFNTDRRIHIASNVYMYIHIVLRVK